MKAIPSKFYKLLLFIFIWSLASTLMVAEEYSFKMIATLVFAATLTSLLLAILLICITALNDIQIYFDKLFSHFRKAFKSKY